MSLSTRLDKLEAAMRGRDGGEPADGLICRRLIYDPSEWQIEEDEAISRKLTSLIDWSLLERSGRSIVSA
jgi:hypothetical protein